MPVPNPAKLDQPCQTSISAKDINELLTSDDAAHDQMGQRERRSLQSGSHNDQSHGHPNHTTASEYVADGEVDSASCESTQTIRRNGNARDNWTLSCNQPLSIMEIDRRSIKSLPDVRIV
jgi:hypothetical protein